VSAIDRARDLQLADEVQEPAIVLVIQVGQVITEIGEIVAHPDFQMIIDMAVNPQQGKL